MRLKLLGSVTKLDKNLILSDDLFIELFGIEDEISRTRIILDLEEQAKILGVKGQFTALLKANQKLVRDSIREQKKAHKGADKQSYETNFSILDVQLKSGVWNASDEGIYMLSGENGTNRITACDHAIFPTYILVNAETGINKIGLQFKVRNTWREIFVDRKMIASATSIIGLADNGVRVTSDNAKALVKYLSDMEALNEFEIPEKTSTSRLGWIGNVFMPYGKDEIVFDNENNMKSLFNSIKAHGSREKWFKTIASIRKKGRFEVMLYMASSFASVLVEPCGALPFIVDLWGGTGKGKTVSLKAATSIWADPSEGAYMTDAKATTTATEVRLNVLNSLPLTIDDMAQIKNQYDGDFSQLIYKWCAGRGRDRSNTKLGLMPETHWRNCILTNAEHSLVTDTMQGGAINRIIDIECDDSDLYEGLSPHDICNTIEHNYGFAGHEFIEKVQELGFDEISNIQKKYEKIIKEVASSKDCEKEEKQVLPMSIVLTADELSEQYIFKDGIRLDINKCVDILKGKGEVSENTRAYTYIRDYILTNPSKFDATSEYGEVLGRFDSVDDNLCIINGSAFTRIMKLAGFQDKPFLKWAVGHGVVEPDKNGNPKKGSTYGGKTTRCVYFRMDYDVDEAFKQLDLGEIPFE